MVESPGVFHDWHGLPEAVQKKSRLLLAVGNVGSTWEASSHEVSGIEQMLSHLCVTLSMTALGNHDKVDVCSSFPHGSRRRNKCRHEVGKQGSCHLRTPAGK